MTPVIDDENRRPDGYVADLPDAIEAIAYMIRRILAAKSDKISDSELDELEAFARRLR